MILLTPRSAVHTRNRPAAVLLFGAGMIGSAISTVLQDSASLSPSVLDLDWNRVDLFSGQLAAIEDRVSVLLAQNSTSSDRSGGLQCVWSAGRAGFSSSESEVARERGQFQEVLQCIERLAIRHPHVPVTMALMSSAGGLFEGQRGVGIDSVPDPIRSYSRLKLQQEEWLLNSPAPLTRKIYRLTSVYGYIRSRQRRGLISTLIANGLCQRPSQITGYATTLRDYVWIEDVADYISRTLLEEESAHSNSVSIMASGKPSSILEIQQIVERTIGRPLSLRFTPDVTNGETMSFDAGVLPRNWHPSELSTNIRKIAVDALSRQTTFMESQGTEEWPVSQPVPLRIPREPTRLRAA